jgi:hypothetical protein
MSDKQQVFIVVRRDRHDSPDLSVHLTRKGADDAVTEFQAVYANEDYTWTEEHWGAPKWVRYVGTEGDDGPNVYIEISEVVE